MVSHGAVIIHQGCQINKITASCSKLQLNIKLQQKIRPCWEECFPALDSVLMHASVTLLLMHIYRQKLWYLPWKTKLLNIQQTSSVTGGNNNMRRWWYTSYKYRIVSVLMYYKCRENICANSTRISISFSFWVCARIMSVWH